jgi:hypothetical protein
MAVDRHSCAVNQGDATDTSKVLKQAKLWWKAFPIRRYFAVLSVSLHVDRVLSSALPRGPFSGALRGALQIPESQPCQAESVGLQREESVGLREETQRDRLTACKS